MSEFTKNNSHSMLSAYQLHSEEIMFKFIHILIASINYCFKTKSHKDEQMFAY